MIINKKIFTGILIIFCFSKNYAQEFTMQKPGTVVPKDSLCLKKCEKKISIVQLASKNNLQKRKAFLKSMYVALPLIALGIFNNDDDGFIDKYEFQEERNEHNLNFHTRADNYLQFAPIAVVYGMNVIGIKGEHDIWNQTALLLKSEFLMAAIVIPVKKYAHVLRPDGSNYSAFPSGHTAQAFLSAEFLRKEYGKKYPWIAAGGYLAAISVGALRVLNNKHWITDVMMGAGIGILSVNLSYLTHQNKWLLWKKKIQFVPVYNGIQPGIYLNYCFGK